MADRYWVATGGGSWSAGVTGAWSATNGGPAGASVPTAADNVFFTSLSGTGTATLSGTCACLNFNSTGYTGSISYTGTTTTLNVSGTSFTLGPTNASVNFGPANGAAYGLSFIANTVTVAINLNGKLSNGQSNILYRGTNAVYNHNDTLPITLYQLYHEVGTLNFVNPIAVTCGMFNSSSGATRTINLNSVTLKVGTASACQIQLTNALTLNSSSASLEIYQAVPNIQAYILINHATSMTFTTIKYSGVWATPGIPASFTWPSNVTVTNLINEMTGTPSYALQFAGFAFTNITGFNGTASGYLSLIISGSSIPFRYNGAGTLVLDKVVCTAAGPTSVAQPFAANIKATNSYIMLPQSGTLTWVTDTTTTYYYVFTSGTSFTPMVAIPSTRNTVHMYGAGAGGGSAVANSRSGGGGGGGGYTKLTNLSFPGGAIAYTIGAAGTINGAGGTTTLLGTYSAGGGGAASGATGGAGGTGSTFNGGTGGNGVNTTIAGGGGSGGAGGPLGKGGNGGTGFSGGAGGGGGGGSGGGTNGGNGVSATVGGTGGSGGPGGGPGGTSISGLQGFGSSSGNGGGGSGTGNRNSGSGGNGSINKTELGIPYLSFTNMWGGYGGKGGGWSNEVQLGMTGWGAGGCGLGVNGATIGGQASAGGSGLLIVMINGIPTPPANGNYFLMF